MPPRKAIPARPPRPTPSGLGTPLPLSGLVAPPTLAPTSRSMGPRACASRSTARVARPATQEAIRMKERFMSPSWLNRCGLQARRSGGGLLGAAVDRHGAGGLRGRVADARARVAAVG